MKLLVTEIRWWREKGAIETDRVYFTKHNALTLKKKWDTGIRKFWPKTYQIEEPND